VPASLPDGRPSPASEGDFGSTGQPKLAIVLSGGGARGAYEAGVLSYVLDELPKTLGRPIRFDIITGTSVGAIHACFLAATVGAPGAGQFLAEMWRSLSIGDVYRMGVGNLLRMPLWLFGLQGSAIPLPVPNGGGDARLPGLFDTGPIEELVTKRIAWPAIHRNIKRGAVSALAVAATEIATGRSVVFIDSQNGADVGWTHDPFVIALPTRIGPSHALASAAIPILFPARKIDRAFYCDGGLRLNTPLAPALRLGADRVMVVGLRHRSTRQEEDRAARRRELAFMHPAYLAGKVLNALLLDRVEYDVERLRKTNEVLRKGSAEFGPEFLERINRPAAGVGQTAYRLIDDCLISPSRDLGDVAGECLGHRGTTSGLRNRLADLAMRTAARGAGPDKDLLSYIFFDRCYSDHLLELGRADASAAHDKLVEFFR